jgi:Na+/H+ antiporter NhaD/arsenite permease-like protein
MSAHEGHNHGFHGPKCWVLTASIGLILGALLSFAVPGDYAAAPHGPEHAAAPAGDHLHEDADSSQASHQPGHDLPEPVRIAGAPDDELPPIVPALPEHEQVSQGAQDPADIPINDLGPHGAPVHESAHEEHGPSPAVPIWLVAPFAMLLLSIAVMPFVNEKFWHRHYPDFAFLLGGLIVAYYFLAFGQAGYLPGESYGQHKMVHTGLEYYSFIALIGGLFVASGGVLVDVRGRGGPLVNTALLAVGAVMANVMGTTGASVLLIRPFLRINKGRLKPIHVVLFIFIVSNCGGALTPIGDPPLYLGYLKGVPFFWTLVHLWPAWAACVAMLLAVFFVIDTVIARKHPFQSEGDTPAERTSVRISGASGLICLALIIGGVFIDPLLKKYAGVEGFPIGPTFQILVAAAAYALADRQIHKANDFNFAPVKEVGLLFIGIFATMAPALGYLAAHGDALGLDSPTAYYFGAGSLSAVLDNAPTYLNFLQVSFGDQEINPETVHAYLATESGSHALVAISLGAVFFGAMTYIGNGPNFMVRAIAVASGLPMPSFFGYLLRSVAILLPVLVVIWAIFIR